MSEETKPRRYITRRNLIRTGVAGSTVLVAGCGGEGDEDISATPLGEGDADTEEPTDASTETGDEGGNSEAIRFTEGTGGDRVSNYENANYNRYIPDSRLSSVDPAGILFDHAVAYLEGADEYVGFIAEDWSVEDQTLELQFREGWTWHNGDSWTAEDYGTQWQLNLELLRQQSDEENPHSHYTSVEIVDDYTLHFELNAPYTAKTALFPIQAQLSNVKADHGDPSYRERLESLREASGDEADEIVTELLEYRQEEPIGNGVIQVRDTSPSEMVGEVFEDHPWSDQVEIDEYAWQQFDDPTVAFMEEQCDCIAEQMPPPEDLQSQMPEWHEINMQNVSLHTITPNHGQYDHPNSSAGEGGYTPYTEDRKFRQAIQHIISRQDLAGLLPAATTTPDWPPCFLPPAMAQDFDLSGFEEYTSEDAASTLLTDLGYQNDGGTWVDGDGNPVEPRVMTQSGSSAIGGPIAQAVTDQLSAFGLQPQLESVDSATFGERRVSGEYDLMTGTTGASSIRDIWSVDKHGWLSSIRHSPDVFEVPMPVGDPEGSVEEVNLRDLRREWARTGEDELIRSMAWVWNQAAIEYEMTFAVSGGGVLGEPWVVEGPEDLVQNIYANKNLITHPDGTIAPE